MYDLLFLFSNQGFEFQNSVCNGCYDLTVLSVNINDIAIKSLTIKSIDITIKNVDYHCIIHKISKSEAISLLKNSVLEDCEYI